MGKVALRRWESGQPCDWGWGSQGPGWQVTFLLRFCSSLKPQEPWLRGGEGHGLRFRFQAVAAPRLVPAPCVWLGLYFCLSPSPSHPYLPLLRSLRLLSPPSLSLSISAWLSPSVCLLPPPLALLPLHPPTSPLPHPRSSFISLETLCPTSFGCE